MRRITADEKEGLLQRYYDPHHRRLTEAVEAKLKTHGRCLIVDGHSFNSVPLPYEPDQEPDRPDFCVGTDSYHTPPRLTAAAIQFLQQKSFSVEINRPYEGSIVPLQYYQQDHRVSSIMIEVNRRLYMNPSGKQGLGFTMTKKTITALLECLSGLIVL